MSDLYPLPSSPVQTVYQAIKHGYRLLDGAGDYGNEKEAGEGVRRAIQDGLVKREELCESLHPALQPHVL
jgi:diketogulonate reductase-like aldo/keto reductase